MLEDKGDIKEKKTKPSLEALSSLVELSGEVTKTFYSSNGFSAGVLTEDKTHRKVRFSGKICVKEGDNIIIKGKFKTDPKYGEGFEISSFSLNIDIKPEGLIKWVVAQKIPGLGIARATKLVSKYNANFEKTDEIAKAIGISESSAQELYKRFEERKIYAAVYSELAAYGITNGVILKLIEHYGNSTLNVIKENPYSIISVVPSFGFKKADIIALKMGVDKKNPNRISSCIIHSLNENEGNGNCWIEYQDLVNKVNKELIIDTLDSKTLIRECINNLNSLVIDTLPNSTQQSVALRATFEKEKYIYDQFKTRKANWSILKKEEIPDLLTKAPWCSLNEDQAKVLDLLTDSTFTLIAGCSGSGKTFSTATIIRLCNEKDIPILLSSPTGKAAKVLEQYSGVTAYTLHRALGYNGRTFNIENTIIRDNSVVFVDEISMISIDIMYALLKATEKKNCLFVFSGDHYQLASIGTGAILKDLTTFDIIPKIVLDKCVRQAGVLKENSNKILKGIVAQTAKHNIGTTDKKPWYKITAYKDSEDIKKYIEHLYNNVFTEKLGYDIIGDVQLLTPTNKADLGTIELNKAIQKIVQRKIYDTIVDDNNKFYEGDKVINTRNNYKTDIMNGSVGIVEEVVSKNELRVKFDDKIVTYKDDEIYDLQLAYALTVHKCVGPNTYVETDFGIQKIQVVHDFGNIGTVEGTKKYINKVYNKALSGYKIVTELGYEIVVTEDHYLDCWISEQFCKQVCHSLLPGDILRLYNGVSLEPSKEVILPELPINNHFNTVDYIVPLTMSENLAEFLGLMVADGCLIKDRGFRLVKRHKDVTERFKYLCEQLFRANPKVIKVNNAYGYEVSSVILYKWLIAIGGLEPKNKRIPECILQSESKYHFKFLKGLFEDGTVNIDSKSKKVNHISYDTEYEDIAILVQLLLLRLNIIATKHKHKNLYSIRLYSENIIKYRDTIGFISSFKQNRLLKATFQKGRYFIPISSNEIKIIREGIELKKSFYQNYYRNRYISRTYADYIINNTTNTDAISLLEDKLKYVYDRIVSISPIITESYCVEVPEGNRFIQNGFSGWNCQGSEYQCVVTVINKKHSFMHNQNLLYTAVTRAKQCSILLGDVWSFTNCAKKKDTQYRKSFIPIFEARK